MRENPFLSAGVSKHGFIKKALWDTAGDWVPEKEYSAQGYFYFDVF